MKLASFNYQGRDRIGFVQGESDLIDYVSASSGAAGQGVELPRTMIDLIEGGEPALARAREVYNAVTSGKANAERISMDAVTWHPPVRRPSKIVCLALNNSANAERIMKGPKHPALFFKTASSLVGHNGAIECRPSYGRVHPEPELAVVIGKKARDISPAESFDHVFGYTIMNDITSPTMRQEDTFHYRAIHPKGGDAGEIEYVDSWTSYPGRYKSSDTFGCLGPWIVTKEEIADPHDLAIACHHQGRLITEDNTCNLFHKTAEVLSFISKHITLDPGDVVAMGTALKKSAAGGAVQNVDLNKLGGPVSVSIEKIGTLSNRVEHLAN